MVNQPEFELQLKVWKELAISKQILMQTAADALQLGPNCSQGELKEALDGVLRKLTKADAELNTSREQAKVAIATMERQLAQSQKAQAAAEAQITALQAAQDTAAKNIAGERAANAKELQKLKDQLVQKDKALKAINTALSDTPENVLRKMSALKKQKQQEADLRKDLEAAFNTLRADKKKQEDAVRGSAKLAKQYRELHAVCVTLHEKLKPLLENKQELPMVPELDDKLLETIEKPAAKLDKS